MNGKSRNDLMKNLMSGALAGEGTAPVTHWGLAMNQVLQLHGRSVKNSLESPEAVLGRALVRDAGQLDALGDAVARFGQTPQAALSESDKETLLRVHVLPDYALELKHWPRRNAH